MLAGGEYFIGTGGDYATLELAFAALAGQMTGHIIFTQISHLTINASILCPITDNADFKLTIRSEREHKGVEADAWITYINDNSPGAIRLSRAIICEIYNMWFQPLVDVSSNGVIGSPDTRNTLGIHCIREFHDNVFNMNNRGDTAIATGTGAGAAPATNILRIWNNLIYNTTGAAGFVAGIEVDQRVPSGENELTVENNTIRGGGKGIITLDNIDVRVRNNVVIDTSALYDCYDFGNQTDSYYNASSDNTADDALIQSGNLINIVENDEFESVVPGHADFMKPKSSGQIYIAGGTPLIPNNVEGLAGNQRPWENKDTEESGFSMGAYEMPSVIPPPDPPPTTIGTIYAGIISNLTQLAGYLSLYNGGIRALLYSYGGELRVFETNKCFKYATSPEQGKGWSEYGGSGWLWPEAGVKGITVFDNKDQPITVVLDAISGLFYRLAPREGPDGSGITKLFKDKVGAEYSPGESIPWRLKLKEHTGPKEHLLIKHTESHVYARPEEEENQGASGYDENGYLEGQEITIKAFVNGEETEAAVTQNIPYKADIVYDRQIEDNRVQIEISGTESALKITGAETTYEVKDQRGAPSERIMEEGEFQLDLSEPIHWLSRGASLTIDRATGDLPTSGSIAGATDGPDNEDDTAMLFSPTSSLNYENSTALNGDFTIMFAIAGVLSTTEVVRFENGGMVRIVVSGGECEIEYSDASGVYSQPMTWDGDGWVFVKVTRDYGVISFSEDGTRINSMSLNSLAILSGDIQYLTGNSKDLFDIRVYDSVISDDAFTYYRTDVLDNNGNALLCY